MDVALGGDDALFQSDFPSGAAEHAARGALQIAGLPDGGGDAQLAGIGEGDFHLGLGAGGAQDGHLHSALGANHFHLLLAGELARLGEVFLVGEGSALAEQGFQVRFGHVDMMGRCFNHNFHGKFLL